MAMVINTNMGAINANRILDKTSVEQSNAMERLTSGLRINKAADDAAGLAVATGMTTQIMGTDQAIRNANDGISLVQTVDGASEEVVNMMQRMRELAVQSLNGTYSSDNRAQMNEEYTQLTSEIERVSKTTQFNGTAVMGNYSTNGQPNSTHLAATDVHVGWQAGEDNKITVSTANFHTSITGSMSTNYNFASAITGRASANLGVDLAGTLLYGVAGNLSAGASVLSNRTLHAAIAVGETAVTAQSAASVAVQVLDGALSNVNNFRAKWGALQNRMESTISNLSNVNENVSAARSQIQDADFARESAELARTQVLQQAGMSMLSQANQQSQNVLSLLR